MSIGRPTKYHKKYCEMLINHMKEGLSFESFGGLIGVSKQTLYDWMEKNPDFLDARRKGDTATALYWEKIGIEGMTNKIQFFNGHIWALNMKNKCKWTENVTVEEKSTRKIDVNISNMSEKEITQLYKELVDNDD